MESIEETAGIITIPSTQSRIIGTYTRDVPGPVLICIGGLHGNELAGVKALHHVIDELHERQPLFRGKFIALSGNMAALEKQVRFVHEDLNRAWLSPRINDLVNNKTPQEDLNPEEHQIVEIYAILKPYLCPGEFPTFLLDMHTTSSESAPFIIMGDTLRNRYFARRIPVPKILGVDEHIGGTLSSYLNERGVISFNFEGGQHDNDSSVRHHISAVWLALASAECMKSTHIPNYNEHGQSLANSTKGLPRLFETRYRYFIRKDQDFKMLEGYTNFQHIRRLEILAETGEKAIKAKENGRIFMPLYQELGEDGFFIIRRISSFWLRISLILRKLKMDRLLPLLPGIFRHPEMKDTLRINTRVARFMPLQVFHLLGYKKISQVHNILYVARRKYDIESKESGSEKKGQS